MSHYFFVVDECEYVILSVYKVAKDTIEKLSSQVLSWILL